MNVLDSWSTFLKQGKKSDRRYISLIKGQAFAPSVNEKSELLIYSKRFKHRMRGEIEYHIHCIPRKVAKTNFKLFLRDNLINFYRTRFGLNSQFPDFAVVRLTKTSTRH